MGVAHCALIFDTGWATTGFSGGKTSEVAVGWSPHVFFFSCSYIGGRSEGSLPRMEPLMNERKRSPYSRGGTAEIMCCMLERQQGACASTFREQTHLVVLQALEKVLEALDEGERRQNIDNALRQVKWVSLALLRNAPGPGLPHSRDSR
jgi:hypothetical protein